MNVKVAQDKEGKGKTREQVLRSEDAVEGGPLVGAVCICDAEPRKGKIKKRRGAKNIERKQIGERGGHRENGGRGDEVRVDIKRNVGAFVGCMKTFPG